MLYSLHINEGDIQTSQDCTSLMHSGTGAVVRGYWIVAQQFRRTEQASKYSTTVETRYSLGRQVEEKVLRVPQAFGLNCSCHAD